MAGLSPTMGQRRLARTLRQLRIDAGLTIDQAAERLELSPSTISRMETAHVGIKRRDVRELLDLYNITGPQRDLDLPPLALSETDHAQRAARDVPKHDRRPDVRRM